MQLEQNHSWSSSGSIVIPTQSLKNNDRDIISIDTLYIYKYLGIAISLASHTPHDLRRGLVIALYQFRSLLQNLEEHTEAVLLMERVDESS